MMRWALALYNLLASGSFVLQILTSLGIGVAVFTGLDTSLSWLRDQAISSLSAMPADVLGMLALMKVGTCISMLFSAFVVRMTLQGLTSGVLKRWIKT